MNADLQPLSALGSLVVPGTMRFYIRPAGRPDSADIIRLVIALAEFEKLDPPDEAAQARLIEDAFGAKPRIEVWLALAEDVRRPVGYAIFLETYSSFLARRGCLSWRSFARPVEKHRQISVLLSVGFVIRRYFILPAGGDGLRAHPDCQRHRRQSRVDHARRKWVVVRSRRSPGIGRTDPSSDQS